MSEDLRLLEFEYNEEKLSLYIKPPTAKDAQEADFKKAMVLQDGLGKGLYLKQQMDNILKDRNLWNSEAEEKIKKLSKELGEKLDKLEAGGIKLSDARALALEISDLRTKIILESAPRQNFANLTADGMAEQAHLDYLVSACVVYNEDRKKKYFKDYQDYLNRKSDLDAFVISRRYAEILYDTIFDEKRLPENEFLRKAKFVDDDLRFINKDGHLTDRAGNLLNENGNKIEYVDGVAVILDGEKAKPFLDDDGNPIDI